MTQKHSPSSEQPPQSLPENIGDSGANDAREGTYTNAILISSISEFEEQLNQLDLSETELLYRGQSDSSWLVSCSAARRLTQDPTNRTLPQLIDSLLVGYLEFLIAKARRRQLFPPQLDVNSSDMNLLAQLQHQGAATGLIDFTCDPLVALWFACHESFNVDGAVYILPVSKTKKIPDDRIHSYKIAALYQDNSWWSWKPDPIGNRITAQSSVFVFGNAKFAPNQMKRLVIPANCKRNILMQLESLHDILEENLYPDFPGYASANAPNKPFDVQSTTSYWQDQLKSTQHQDLIPIAHYNCGIAYAAIGNFDEAIEHFDNAVALNSRLASAYYNRGNAKDELNQLEEAILDYDIAIRLRPNNPLIYSRRGASKSRLGLHSESMQDHNESIRINPSSAQAYTYRGISYAADGNHFDAISDYNTAIQINPESDIAYLNRGNANVALEQYENAKSDYDIALRINPQNDEILTNRGNVKLFFDLYEDAIADFDLAIQINPNNALSFHNRGNAKLSRKSYEEAISDYRRAILLDPNIMLTHYQLGVANFSLGQTKEAIAHFDDAIRLDPCFADSYNRRGYANSTLGLYDEAINDFDDAIRINSNHIDALLGRGLIKAMRTQYNEALVDFDTLIRVAPDSTPAYYNRGLVKRDLQKHAGAVEDFLQTLVLAHQQNSQEFLQRAKQELERYGHV